MLLVRAYPTAQGSGEVGAHIPGGLSDTRPVAVRGHLETMLVGVVLAMLREHRRVFLVPDVTDPLEEEPRKSGRFPVRSIDRSSSDNVVGFRHVGAWRGQCHGRGLDGLTGHG